MNTLHRDHIALRRRMVAAGVLGMLAFQRRDEPSVKSIADSIDKINTAFSEYKQTNDARLEAIKDGKGTADLDAKLAKMDEVMNRLSEQKAELEVIQTKLARPGVLDSRSRLEDETREQAEYRGAFVDWMRRPGDYERQQKATLALKALESKSTEANTLTGAAGGYGLPLIIERAILRIGLDISPIRQISTVRTIGGTNYKELIDVNGAGFSWLGETNARPETNTPNLVEIAPTIGMASAHPQASEESLDDLFFDVSSWLIESAGIAIAKGEGAAFIAGTGVNQPTGFLSGPAPVAIGDPTRTFGTLQYTPSLLAAAMPASPDTLYDLIYSLRARYRAGARWVTAKALVSQLRKYKSTTGEYQWQESLAPGQPSTFMGYAITEAEDMPILAANAFPLAFGDFRQGYLVVDRVAMRMTRDEITTPGYVKFYIRKRVGGSLRNTEAIKLLKIALS